MYIVDNARLARSAQVGGVDAVDTQDLLLHNLRAAGNDARFGRGGTVRVGDQAFLVHVEVSDGAAQALAGEIVADDARQEDLCAQCAGIDGHFGRAARDGPFLVQIEDQDRGITSDTRGPAAEVFV